jgi:DNA replication protein DnaC
MIQNPQMMGQDLAGKLFKDINIPFRRDLNNNDLERMRVPRRYWMSRFDLLSDEDNGRGDGSIKDLIERYMKNMSDMKKEGCGLILFGDNSVGKTCASVVLAKEFRRRGNTVLFIEASDLKRLVASKEYFDDDETYWERSKDVDVLVIDDFGKGIMDDTGFGATIFDELIRSRNANKKITIITSNIKPQKWKDEIDLKISTIKTLKECTVPFHVKGIDYREISRERLNERLYS